MIASRCSPELLTSLVNLRWTVGQVGAEQHLGHAQHAVHRGADLVAHGGQEGALRAAGGLGRVLGLFQLLGAHADLAFELVAVVGQGGAAALDLGQHVVEAVDQGAQLVGALVRDAQGVVLAGRYFLRRIDQLGHRVGDAALEAAGQQQRHQQRAAHRGGDHAQALEDVEPHIGQVRFDHDHADLLVAARHVAVQAHARAPERAALRVRLGQRVFAEADRLDVVERFLGAAGRDVAREHLAVAVEQGGVGDFVFRLQRRQGVLGRIAVVEHQRVDAVGADHAGERGQLHAFVLAVVEHRGHGEGDEHEQQGGAGRQERDDRQFLVEAGALEVQHGLTWRTER